MAEWEIAAARLYDPDMTADQYVEISYRVAELRALAPIQPNPIFICYTHDDSLFVDELQSALNEKDIRSWRDIHHAEAGPMDKVIDRAITLNPTMVLVLSEGKYSPQPVLTGRRSHGPFVRQNGSVIAPGRRIAAKAASRR